MLAAALDGIDHGLIPPTPMSNVNVYKLTAAERQEQGIPELPGSLAEALRELEEDKVLRNALQEDIFTAFCRAKWAEVEEYRMKVSDWEVERYLEQA